MAAKIGTFTSGCIFQWKIENLSQCCWLRKGVALVSPTFITHPIYGTKWSLHLFPMGIENFKNSISLSIERENDYVRLEIKVNCHFAFLSKGGTILSEWKSDFYLKSGEMDGKSKFETQKRVFLTQRKEFLPEDTLTVQCTLREYGEITTVHYNRMYARTAFKVNRKSVLWKIDSFSSVKPGLRNKLKDNLIDLDLVLNKDGFNVDVVSYDNSIKYISLNISIIDSKFKKTNCAIGEFNGLKMQSSVFGGSVEVYGIFDQTYYISHILQKLMRKKNQFIPNNVLTLNIEYVYSTEVHSYECFDSATDSSQMENDFIDNGNELDIERQNILTPSILVDDLKSMYNNEVFSDMKLHTLSQTFPVHKSILSARSPVFNRMFNHDMKEKNSGQVHITDLENETLHRMLLFIYTDVLEDLQFESASKLYAAADKYEIMSLKSRCSSFLKNNIRPAKVCDALILADSHQDEDLKRFLQSYILEHNEVFRLQQWKDLMENNLKLAAEIMYKNIQPYNV